MFLELLDSMKQENTRQDKKYVDLHSHTNYSDGLYSTPKQNVMLAALKGIDIFAITDHDTTLGYAEAKEEAEKVGLTLIPGVEITTPKYHLLAFNFDPENKPFLDFLQYSKDIQKDRCLQRVNSLRKHGYSLTFNEILENFPDSRLAKYNIFATMFRNAQCRAKMERDYPGFSPLQRFRKLFSGNGPVGHLLDNGVSESEAIYYVHEAGGIIGIAHPSKDIKDMTEMERLADLGIDFVEVQPNFRGKENGGNRYSIEDFERFAKKNSLPISYGSDYHGPTFDRAMLERGENVLHEDLEELLNKGYVKIPSCFIPLIFPNDILIGFFIFLISL
jgi:predicted metal-dependent phosphoesterase TrpH